MSDLDEKLANIVETHGLQSYDTDVTVEQIKQAFADAGYRDYKLDFDQLHQHLKELEDLMNEGRMTGQEWYNKYKILCMESGYYSDDLPMMKLARRVAGFDTEGEG